MSNASSPRAALEHFLAETAPELARNCHTAILSGTEALAALRSAVDDAAKALAIDPPELPDAADPNDSNAITAMVAEMQAHVDAMVERMKN